VFESGVVFELCRGYLFAPVMTPMKPFRPTPAQLAAARHKTLRDVIARNLGVLFCGINPGLYSAAVGHHFARPGNRFWPALHRSGFTDRQLSPFEDRRLLEYGCGVTNVVPRPTAAAAELSSEEFRAGAAALERTLKRYAPAWVAFVGIGAYRTAFVDPLACVGPQDRPIGPSRVWVLPNTSGLNANYQSADLAKLFAALRQAAGFPSSAPQPV
jgi:double-stranded uracil-DNA glycosylase